MNKRNLIIAALLVIILIAPPLGATLNRLGKIKINILAAPSTSTVKIDGKTTSKTQIYLTKGKHTFEARLNGFSSDSKTLNIAQPTTIKLLLDPQTDEAKQLLTNNPKLQLEREQIGSSDFEENSKKIGEKYPYLSQLPISGARFSVSYGLSQQTKKQNNGPTIALYIEATDAGERRNALKNIVQELNIDPSSVEIVFEGYVNPFAQEANGE
jgi:hypothetical protein